MINMITNMLSSAVSNDLASLKAYFDSGQVVSNSMFPRLNTATISHHKFIVQILKQFIR